MAERSIAQPGPARSPLSAVLWLAWAAGVIATVLGFLAPWLPIFELINDGRVFLAAASVLLFGAAVWRRDWRLLRPCAALALLQVALTLLPFARAAGSEPGRAPALRLVTFNLALTNERFDDVATFILDSGADIAVLQEVSCPAAEKLIPKLRPALPHVLVSAETCHGMALLSKRPWTSVGQTAMGLRRPLLMWARFDWGGVSFDLTTAHLSRPFAWAEQAAQVARLISHLQSRGPTQILAGDLNLTPYAWSFAQLNNAGLRPHATFLASWPSAMPVILIDHVLSTDDIVSTRIRTGPNVGSDHLPVIADIAFEK